MPFKSDMTQPSDGIGSINPPVGLELPQSTPPQLPTQKDRADGPQSAVSDPTELLAQKAAPSRKATRSARGSSHSEPLPQPSTVPIAQPPPSSALPNTENVASSRISHPPRQSGIQPNTSSRDNANHSADESEQEKIPVTKPKSSLYKKAREMIKFVEEEYPLAFNSLLVIAGVLLMLSGTFIVHAVLLPKIYTCPDGATCHHNLDPKGAIVPRLPTVMQYWLQGGVFVASLGLSNFMAYESWTIVEGPNGSRLTELEDQIDAVNGGLFATLSLFWMPLAYGIRQLPRLFGFSASSTPQYSGPRLLGTFALLQFGIGFFISLVVSFSITDLRGAMTVYVPFTYHSDFAIPRQDVRFVSSGEFVIANQLTNWLLPTRGSGRPITAFDGTLVLRDNRTLSAIKNPQPSGSSITGDISCSRQGWNASILSPDSPYLADGHGALPPGAKAYNLTNGTYWFATYSYTHLSSIFITRPELSDAVTSRQYLWASNSSNVIPNATVSSDGGLHFALCEHTTRLVSLPPVDKPGTQDILPSQPIIYTDPDDPFLNPCPSTDPMACLSRFIDEAVLAFWIASVVQLDMIPFSCVTDVLVGYDGISDTSDCTLTNARWATTLSTTLDAFISTAGLSGNTTKTQYLFATADSINADRWWIQTTLPGVTLLLFLACLAYTLYLSPQAQPNLRKLALSDVLQKGTLEDMRVTMDTPSHV